MDQEDDFLGDFPKYTSENDLKIQKSLENSFTKNLSVDKYLYLGVFCFQNIQTNNIFFFVLLDIEKSKMIDFDLLAFKKSNDSTLDISNFNYSELRFMFQSIINNYEILSLSIDSIKNEIKDNYLVKEDFTEIVVHYLALNQKNYLIDYLKTILKKNINGDLNLQFSCYFIDKSQKYNIIYNFNMLEDEKVLEEVVTKKINFTLNIDPLKGLPLYKVRKEDEILAKPLTQNIELIRQIQTDYEEGEEPKLVWVLVKETLHKEKFTKLIVSVKGIIGEISEEENHIKVNIRKKNKKKVENNVNNIFEEILKKKVKSSDIKNILFFCIIFLSVMVFIKYL